MDEPMIAEPASGVGKVFRESDDISVGPHSYVVTIRETFYSPKETDLTVLFNESEIRQLATQTLILHLQDGRRLKFILQGSGATDVLNWLDVDGEDE